MKITCERSKLAEALLNVQRAVSPKSNLAALEGIFISAESEDLQLCGYNTELAIKTTLQANIAETGKIVIGAKLLTEIVRKLPSEDVSLTVLENLNVTIKSGFSEFSLVGINAEEFPEIPEIENSDCIEIPCHTAKSMIKQTLFAIAENDAKPVHTGTLFDVKENELKLVSVDGYRMAIRKEPIKGGTEINFVVPGKALSEVLKLLPDGEDKNLIINAGQRHIKFDTGNYSIISRLLDGDFLEYEASIPDTCKTKIDVNTRLMLESVERTSIIITERLKSPIKCIFSSGMAQLSCSTPMGKANDEFLASIEGEDMEIGFNSKYMTDALKNVDTDEIVIELNGPLSPIKVLPKKGESFLFLVLPVRLRS